MTTRLRLAAAPAITLALLGACSDDAPTATAGGNDELCELAEEMDAAEDFPTPDQLDRYAELAPEQLQAAVATTGEAVSAGELTAVLAAIAEDDVEDAIDELNAFETDECGIDHTDDMSPHQEVEDGAALVEVTATDYAFDAPATLAAGRTSFRLVNDGAEAHFLALTKLVEGHTLDEALEFEGDPEEAGLVEGVEGGDSALAAPGGDEEVVNVDLEPGDYAMLCFIPGPDGTPHAFLGMISEFTVA